MDAAAAARFKLGVEWVDGYEWRPSLLSLSQWWMPVTASAVYVPSVLLLARWVKARPKLNTRWVDAVSLVYNVIITLLSLLTCLAGLIPLAKRGIILGPKYVLCDDDGTSMTGLLGLSGYVYYLTKYIELADTVFLCLKRKNLGLLHVYHHAAMPIMSWLWVSSGTIMLAWMVILNSFIHVFMYWYYFMADMGIQMWWKQHLTSAQIVQLVAGLYLCFHWLYYRHWCGCVGSSTEVWVAIVLNVFLITLFVQFYVNSYLKERKKHAEKQKKKD
jgi:hypothetical protein